MEVCDGLDHVSAFRGTREKDGHLYYVMDWYNKTLKDEIEDSSSLLTAKKVLKYGRDITRGVSELHAVGIVCMNINPSSILLDEKGNAFVSDYGLSPSICAQNTYAAPETWGAFNGKEPFHPSLKSDIWSLGCTLLQMSSNYSLWEGLDTAQINKFVKQKKLPIVLSELVEGPLFEIIDGCLKFEQEERLSSYQIKTKFLNHARSPITLHQNPKIVKMDETHQYILECLHRCIRQDDGPGVRCLLEKSRDVDFLLKDEVDGLFAVLLACRLGSEKSLKELLNAGADVNVIEGQRDYILHMTIEREHHGCALLILKHNGSMRKLNSDNKTPLHLCIEMRNVGLLKEWVSFATEDEKGAANICGPAGAPLCMAATAVNDEQDEEGHALVKLLLQAGANRSGVDPEGLTAMHIAAMKDDFKLMEILLQGEGASYVDIRNFRERTPLHVALQHGAKSCIGLLLMSGANYKLKDDNGENALHIAASTALQFPENLTSFIQILQSSPPPPDSVFEEKNYSRMWTVEDFLKALPQELIFTNLKNKLRERGIHLNVARDTPMAGRPYLFKTHRDLNDAKSNGLTDARKAGVDGYQCTLIITEGESAAKFVKKGLSVVQGHLDKYGVYALCGKPVNMSERTDCDNAEVQDIFSALGLKKEHAVGTDGRIRHCYVFDGIKSLRYRYVLMMTDQDVDGAHIKALLINIFYCLCPALLKVPLFLQDFTTYAIKATHKKTKKIHSFKFAKECQAWQRTIIPSDWKFEYLKGLASSYKDAPAYFRDMAKHTRFFVWDYVVDANYLNKAFKDKSDERKTWILQYQIGCGNPYCDAILTCGDFIEKELMLFFFENNRRHLPSAIDGLKPTQRKVLCFFLEQGEAIRTGNISMSRVTQLAGAISKEFSYQHGEQSIENLIVKMAGGIGSNNIDLLQPIGDVTDAAARYLSTEIAPISRLIFPKEDDCLLKRLNEDGRDMEPDCYVPIVPLALINYCHGIGSGFSCDVPNYHPRHVIDNVRRLLAGEEVTDMVLWYPEGTVLSLKNSKGKQTNTLCANYNFALRQNEHILTIKCLGSGESYENYEQFLVSKKEDGTIEDFEKMANEYGHEHPSFEVKIKNSLTEAQVFKLFRLGKPLYTSNMFMFNAAGSLYGYRSTREVLHHHFPVRFDLYKRREELGGLQSRLKELEGLHGPEVEIEKNELLEKIKNTASDLWKKDLVSLEEELKLIYQDMWEI